MRLALCLIVFQTGYIMAKTIDNPNLCNEPPENDTRLKRSDEEDKNSHITDTAEKTFDNIPKRKTYYTVNTGKYDNNYNNDETDRGYAENDSEDEITSRSSNSNEFEANPNALPQKLRNDTKISANNEKRDQIINLIKNNPSNGPVFYQKIDPKDIIISKPYKPLSENKMIVANDKKTETRKVSDNDLKETKSIVKYLIPENSNLSKIINVSSLRIDEDTENNKTITAEIDVNETDVSNVRELRQHLLDHLLNYFLNIIKEEQYYNDTRKRNGKDKMNVKTKLSNYYDPNHLDFIIVDDDDSDSDENEADPPDYRRKNVDEDLLQNKQNCSDVNSENKTNDDPFNTTEIGTEKDTLNIDDNFGNLNKTSNLEEKQNTTNDIPDKESLYVDLTEAFPVTTKYIILTEKKNVSNNILPNTTIASKPLDTNVTSSERTTNQVTTTFKPNTTTADPLAYLKGEVVTDRIGYNEDNSGEIIEDYVYDDFTEPDDLQRAKNITNASINKDSKNENETDLVGREKKNILDSKLNNATAKNALNETNNIGNITQVATNATFNKSENLLTVINKKFKSRSRAMLVLQNKYKNADNSPYCDDDGNNKKCGELHVNNNNKIKKLHRKICRKSIILNLNINLL